MSKGSAGPESTQLIWLHLGNSATTSSEEGQGWNPPGERGMDGRRTGVPKADLRTFQ